MFRKFEKITLRWIALFTFRTQLTRDIELLAILNYFFTITCAHIVGGAKLTDLIFEKPNCPSTRLRLVPTSVSGSRRLLTTSSGPDHWPVLSFWFTQWSDGEFKPSTCSVLILTLVPRLLLASQEPALSWAGGTFSFPGSTIWSSERNWWTETRCCSSTRRTCSSMNRNCQFHEALYRNGRRSNLS